jgi:hypothetical protein
MKGALFLPAYEQGFLDDNRRLLPPLLEGTFGIRLALTVCTNWRRAAIASLLQSGQAAQFHRRLQRSGTAYLHFLRQASPAQTRLSDSAPFLDAVAAGDDRTAAGISERSNRSWVRDEEYEEDFLFYEFVMRHSAARSPLAPTMALLDRWEACLAGTEDPRLAVCRALVGSDSAVFDAALVDYLGRRERERRAELDMQEPEAAATEASVSVEGLAFRRLAAERGLTPAAEHPQIPVPLSQPAIAWPADSFRTIE